MSPGPGKPSDFGCSNAIAMCCSEKIPIFGVCLGLQAMVEHFGGELGVLGIPFHGKPSVITQIDNDKKKLLKWNILDELPDQFTVARYHSLHGKVIPSCLIPTCYTSDGVVMAIEHETLPLGAVQFHPESILTSPKLGMKILMNALNKLEYKS